MSVQFHQQIDVFLLRAPPVAVGTEMRFCPRWPSTNVAMLAPALLACSISLCSYTYRSFGYLQHRLKNMVLRLSCHPVH